MKDCTFCKIMKDEIPSYTIFEDDYVKVFLSIEPIAAGHLLIVPKKHFKDLEDIDESTLSHINAVSKKMYFLMKEKLNFKGLKIVQNNGTFQDIKHYHMHLIPAYDEDKNMSLEDVYKILTK